MVIIHELGETKDGQVLLKKSISQSRGRAYRSTGKAGIEAMKVGYDVFPSSITGDCSLKPNEVNSFYNHLNSTVTAGNKALQDVKKHKNFNTYTNEKIKQYGDLAKDTKVPHTLPRGGKHKSPIDNRTTKEKIKAIAYNAAISMNNEL